MTDSLHARGLVAVGCVAFALSWGLVRLIREVAVRRGILDVPNARSSHVQPTPRLGGAGLLAAIAVPVAVFAASTGTLVSGLVVVLGLGVAVSLVSLLDDLRSLPAGLRLAMHLGAAVVAVWWVGPFDLVIPGLGDGARRVAAEALTVVWIAGFINAFNFMDGIDGIAGVQAFVAAAAWGIAGWWLGQPSVALLGMAIAAASAGFLWHNWPPASIFMGDVGSALLGCLLATLPLLAPSPRPLWTALLPVWPFVFDTTVTLLRRARRGEALMTAHRSHLYQRLTQAGWPHAQTAMLYGTLAGAGAVVAVLMATGAVTTAVPGVTVLVAGATLLWMLASRAEARYRQAPARPTATRRSDHA